MLENSYSYVSNDDAGGKRYRKNETWYEYEGDKLLREIRPDGSKLTFIYDVLGVLGFNYRTNFGYNENGELSYDEKYYFYRKNLQGDVIAVYDEKGTKCAEYKYDAWGNCTAVCDVDNISLINPIRYRSYYYDTETDLYYLNSRYYDPETGRFINGDVMLDYRSIHGFNLYSYCYNNPIVYSDPGGHRSISIREFVESRGGTVVWDSIAECSVFVLNDKTLTIGRFGNNSLGIDCYNYHGRMMAEDYDLAYYFRVKNWSTYFPGFSWNNGNPKDGFMVTTTRHFFSKDFCQDYAADVMKAAGVKFLYCGKSSLGVAIECYAHAMLLLYSSFSIALIDRGYKFRGSAEAIGFERGDWHTMFYNWIWFNDSKLNSLEESYVFYK